MDELTFEQPTILLASASPRRSQVLTEAGIKFKKIAAAIDDSTINYDFPHENVSDEEHRKYSLFMAHAKLKPFVGLVKNGAVLTSDCTVNCMGRILEKPVTIERAREQHNFISGKANKVFTSHAIYFNGKIADAVRVSDVFFKNMTAEEIEHVIADPEVLDCAGYKFGGRIHDFAKYDKDEYNNIRGFDTDTVLKLLRRVDFPENEIWR